jgi:hypothetical protein
MRMDHVGPLQVSRWSSPVGPVPVLRSSCRRFESSSAWKTRSTFVPKSPIGKRLGVCFDERPTQFIGEVRQPIKLKPGQLERRISTAELFIFLDVHSHRPPYRHRCLHAETRGRSLSKAERVRVVLALMRAQQSGRPDPSATSERD